MRGNFLHDSERILLPVFTLKVKNKKSYQLAQQQPFYHNSFTSTSLNVLLRSAFQNDLFLQGALQTSCPCLLPQESPQLTSPRVHWSHLLLGWPISNNKSTCATKSFPFLSPSGASLKVIPSLELPTGLTESSIEISSIIVSTSPCVQACVLLFSSMSVNPKGILQKPLTCKSLYSSASQGTQPVTLIDWSLCPLLGVQTFPLWKYSNCTNLI